MGWPSHHAEGQGNIMPSCRRGIDRRGRAQSEEWGRGQHRGRIGVCPRRGQRLITRSVPVVFATLSPPATLCDSFGMVDARQRERLPQGSIEGGSRRSTRSGVPPENRPHRMDRSRRDRRCLQPGITALRRSRTSDSRSRDTIAARGDRLQRRDFRTGSDRGGSGGRLSEASS
ncbi:hypothetical protein Mal33_17080 [Rosistilla oblonga]|uniref:Uncharacterized protein n=1 Tax=Rosistilla oblonga TaxID=2527990 RepID=A0A518IRK9_9BACT|nr:hypothetical protein Mal33_17080 [Rosistilla oblonga]